MTERENIEAIQKHLAAIKQIARDEIARAKEGGNPELINAWSKAFHKTGLLHCELTDDLLRLFPAFGSDVVAYGPGGR